MKISTLLLAAVGTLAVAMPFAATDASAYTVKKVIIHRHVMHPRHVMRPHFRGHHRHVVVVKKVVR